MAHFGPVAIIPARAMRDNRHLFQNSHRKGRNQDVPINAAYYLTPRQHQQQQETSFQRYQHHVSNGDVHYRRGGPPSTFERPSSRMGYPPSTPLAYRRSNSQPIRAAHASKSKSRVSRTRSYSTGLFVEPEPFFRGPVRSYSGPIKYPQPMYRKQRYQVGPPYELGVYPSASKSYIGPNYMSPGAGGRLRTYHKYETYNTSAGHHNRYAPTYTTYPPSTLYRQRRDHYDKRGFRYGIIWRVLLKLLQLLVGGCVIGLVVGPTTGSYFYNFVAYTRSQGQLAVVILAALCLIFTACLLLTIGIARTSQGWASVDAIFSAMAVVMYLVIGVVEAWYAACYPPIGLIYAGSFCRRPEWIAAAILAFVNFLLYAADLVLSIQSGESLSF